MVCREGCPTQDHLSYAACLKAANFHVPKQESQYHGATTPKAWDAELGAYRKARADGIQPQSTKMRDINAAVDISRQAGKPFDATTMTFSE